MLRKVNCNLPVYHAVLAVLSVLASHELVAQTLEVLPQAMAFGTQAFGTVSQSRTLQLANQGKVPLAINGIVTSGGFTQTNTCTSPLAPGAACNINVKFNPTQLGTVTGSVTISNSDASSPQIISLSGTGVSQLGLFPPLVTFPSTAVGSSSEPEKVAITNSLDVPLALSGISASGDFSQTNDCPNTLSPSANCTAVVTFTPSATGLISGVLSVASKALGAPRTIPLSGTGTGSATSPLALSPPQLSFGPQTILSTSKSQKVTVINQGNTAILISGVSVTGPFQLDNHCLNVSLPPGGQCHLTLDFFPRFVGNLAGAVTITDADKTSPQVLGLLGTGVMPLTLNPGSVTFSKRLPGTTSPARMVTLTNTQATTLAIQNISASTGFAQTNNCPAQLVAGASCVISVTFSPQRAGSMTGGLTIVDSGAQSPQVVSLYGSGQGPNSSITLLENAKQGDPGWRLSRVALNNEIEGYASATSVNRGESISFFVNTAAPSYTMDIFRLGWYDGVGARRMLATITLPGVQQPPPIVDPVTRLVQCPWAANYTLPVPFDASDPTAWPSGIYLVKLTESVGKMQRYMIFSVRDDARASDLLFQSPVTEYAANNKWGGYSLYSVPQAYKVSFDRPYTGGDGTGTLAMWGVEVSMLRFLEREGYDVTYVTDIDTDRDPNLLLSHKGFLSLEKDTYWTWQMRDNVEAARDRGVSLGFFGAAPSYYQVRLEPSTLSGNPGRTMVSYKKATLDPYFSDGNPAHKHLVTSAFRSSPVKRPEAQMAGAEYLYDLYPSELQMDLVVSAGSHWIFDGTGVQNGDRLAGLMGYDMDAIGVGSPSNVISFTHSPFPSDDGTLYADTTVYTASSGATVVDSGIFWPWGLDDLPFPVHTVVTNPAAQQATRNILARFGANAP